MTGNGWEGPEIESTLPEARGKESIPLCKAILVEAVRPGPHTKQTPYLAEKLGTVA